MLPVVSVISKTSPASIGDKSIMVEANQPQNDPSAKKKTGEYLYDDADLIKKSVERPADAPPPMPQPAPPSSEGGDIGGMTIPVGIPLDKNLARGTLNAFRPRLILNHEGQVQSHFLPDKTTLIGRRQSEGSDVQLVISNDSVSSRHARIIFEGDRFTIEDLGSTNQTVVNGTILTPHQAYPLPAESHLRLGSVDLLFVIDADPLTCKRISPDTYAATGSFLTYKGLLKKKHLKEAQDYAFKNLVTLGEALVLTQRMDVSTWSDNYRRAQAGFTVQKGSDSQKMLVLLMLGVLALLVITGALIYFYLL